MVLESHRSRAPAESDASESPSIGAQFKTQLCQLKYRCAISLCILFVLLFETILRRIEEYVNRLGGETRDELNYGGS